MRSVKQRHGQTVYLLLAAPSGISDIFICYSRTDSTVAVGVAERLRVQGWSVFLDVQTHVGKRWAQEIEKELHAAKAVVALWSAKSGSLQEREIYARLAAALGE